MLKRIFINIDSLLTRQRVVGYSRITLAILIITLIVASFIGHIDRSVFNQGDFRAFYTAGVMVKNSKDKDDLNLYDMEKQKFIQLKHELIKENENPTIFINPPIYAWLMIPLSKLSYALALNVWRVISIIVVIFSIIILIKLLKIDLKWWDIFIILVLSMPGFAVLLSGQNTFFFIGLYTLVYLLLIKGFDFIAGLILGFGILKPQLFIFLPFAFFIQKRWTLLLGFATGVFSLTMATFLMFGRKGINDYISTFTSDVYIYGIQMEQLDIMHSFPAFIRLIFGSQINSTFLAVISLIFLNIVFGYLSVKKNIRMETSSLLSLSILGSLIVAPHLFHYDLALLLIPLLLMYAWTKNNRQDYEISRNSRLTILALYFFMWLSLFVTEIIRVQISVIILFYMFTLILRQSKSSKDYEMTQSHGLTPL